MAVLCVVSGAEDFDPQQAAALVLEQVEGHVTFRRSTYHGHQALTARLPYSQDAELRLRALALAESSNFDIIYQQQAVSLARPGMLMMDMDMTTVQIEGIDELARRLGVYERVAALTAQAMQGQLDFKTSLTMRVAELRGADAAIIAQVREAMPETPGLGALLALLKRHGFKVGIASGGFTQLISAIDQRYGLDAICANTLEIAEGRLTGRVAGPIVDAEAKAAAFRELQQRWGLPREQTICLGDGANDLLMLSQAGLSVAYHGKPAVVRQARCSLSHSDLHAIALYLQCASDCP